jgi:undecaprenyl-diphosphatase
VPGNGISRYLRKLQLSTFPQQFVQLVERGVESSVRGGAGEGDPYDPVVRRALWPAAAGAALLLAIGLAAARVGEHPGSLSNWQALVLGTVQGLTELLPISSSGHLVLVPWLADWEFWRDNRRFTHTFDVGLHVGTLIAITAYFRHEVVDLPRAWWRSVRRRSVEGVEERRAWVVVVATLPAVVVGGLGEGLVARRLGQPWQIALLLALFAVVLYIADRRPAVRHIDDVRLRHAVVVGFAQALALAPGVSRSGVTISAARFLEVERDSAARLSFLLLIPVTFGAVVYKGISDVLLGDLPPGVWGPLAVGTLASAVSGLFAIWALLGYVRRHDYSVFVVYRLLAAGAVAALILTGVRTAGF